MDGKDFPAACWSTNSEVADDPNSVVGLLTFSGDSYLQLEIPTDVLLDWPEVSVEGGSAQIHTFEGVRADQVYGYSQKGDYYLLRDVVSSGPGISIPGMQRQVIQGSSLLVSKQPIEPNPLIQSISVEFPGLREWVGMVPFQVQSKYNKERFLEMNFHFSRDDFERITIFENEFASIVVDFVNIHKGGRTSPFVFSFETDCKLTVEIKGSPFTLDQTMHQWVHPAIDLLSFLMGFRYSITSVQFKTKDSVSADYYAPFVGVTGNPTEIKLSSIPFSYKTIEEAINGIAERWFSFDEYARNSATLQTSLMHNWKTPLDMLFLASAQAFEAASRSGVDEQELPDEKLNEYIQSIKESDLSGKIKKWCCYKLKDSKWKSADKLAENLLNDLEPFTSFVVSDIERFMSDHREYRNAYTHRREIKRSSKLTNKELFHHTEAVQLLSYGAIAKMLGIGPEETIKAFEESGYRQNSLYRARRLYRLPNLQSGNSDNTATLC